MIFEPTDLPGVVRILCQPIADDRGFFTRLFCADEFAAVLRLFAGADEHANHPSRSRNRPRRTWKSL
jgi:dTDP-4-dehydrorhamnose 3,5-epimerase-like enzyme